MSTHDNDPSKAKTGVDIWTRFERGPLTLPETPGAREAWHRGRERYAVWLIRLRALSVQERVLQIAGLLSESLTPQPLTDLHVTVFVAGFPAAVGLHDDDIGNENLQAQVEGMKSFPKGSLTLRVGGANSFLSAPFLEIDDPRGCLDSLRRRLGAYAREVRFAAYHPHLTIGSYRAARETQALAKSLQPWRDLPPLEVRISSLELATFDTQVAGAPLTTAHEIPLT